MPAKAYRIVPGVAADKLDDVAKITPVELAAFINVTIERGRSEIVKRSPTGWSGALKGGYGTEMRGVGTTRPVGIIGNPILYHDVVEEGRRPGKMPPVAALIPWVGSKLGIPPGPARESVAFLIARKIGRSGTPPQLMVENGWSAAVDQAETDARKLGVRIVRPLS